MQTIREIQKETQNSGNARDVWKLPVSHMNQFTHDIKKHKKEMVKMIKTQINKNEFNTVDLLLTFADVFSAQHQKDLAFKFSDNEFYFENEQKIAEFLIAKFANPGEFIEVTDYITVTKGE